jgi:hypothetical protein
MLRTLLKPLLNFKHPIERRVGWRQVGLEPDAHARQPHRLLSHHGVRPPHSASLNARKRSFGAHQA